MTDRVLIRCENLVHVYPDGVRLSCVSTRTGEGASRPRRRRQGAGGEAPEAPVEAHPRKGNLENGVWFEGSDGWVFVTRGKIEASDRAILEEPLPGSAVRLYASNNHMGNFFECVRTRKAPICDVEVGHRSATVCHLAGIALRVGRKLTWDPAKEEFAGDREANAQLAREQRKPWTYDAV